MSPIRKQFTPVSAPPASAVKGAVGGGAPTRATPPQKTGNPLGIGGGSPQMDVLKKRITGGPVTLGGGKIR